MPMSTFAASLSARDELGSASPIPLPAPYFQPHRCPKSHTDVALEASDIKKQKPYITYSGTVVAPYIICSW